MTARRPPIWIVFLTIGALLLAAYAYIPGPWKGSGPLFNLLGFLPVAAILAGVWIHKPSSRAPWLFFAGGFLLFWMGDLYTYTYPRVFGAEVPFPSLGDGLYVLVYPVLMAGLLILVVKRNPESDRPGLIDSLIMTLGCALVVWVALIAPNLHFDQTTLQKIVSAAYPLGDILLLAAAIRLAVDAGTRRPAFYLMTGAILALLATDFVYGRYILAGTFTFQVGFDMGWAAFYLLWGAAALHPSMRGLDSPAPNFVPRLTRFRLLLLTAASMIAPVLLLTDEVGEKNIDMVVVIATSVVLVGLVVLRMSGLVHQQERSADREKVLTAAGTSLVGATDRDEIHDAALSAVRSFTGEASVAFLCQISDESHQARVSAVRGPVTSPGRSWAIQGATANLLTSTAEDQRQQTTTVPAETAGDLRLDHQHKNLLVLELAAGDGQRQFLAVASTEPVPGVVESSLRALANHVSLALESALLAEEIHRRSSEARFKSLIQQSSDLITVLDADATVIYQSPAIERVLGYKAEEIVGTRFDRLLPVSEKGRLSHLLADDETSLGNGETQVLECRLDHIDGSTRYFEILHTNLLHDEHIQGIVLNSRDVSERKAFEEQLAHQAFHDPVTNLANRALFAERARHAVARTRRGNSSLAVIFVDLDDFKTVNDSLGHTAGDSVLLQVAQRLAMTIRASDTAARFGGDEFAILLEDLESPQEAADAAERILATLVEPIRVDEKELYINASIGIAVMEPGNVVDGSDLIRDADVAMYMAKRDGKGTYRLFEPEMHAGVVDRLELRGDLQHALAIDQFELHYQPIVRLSDGTITGVEALVRWRHPERGLLSPDWFIPLAEETGLIVPIGRWVLQEGCRQAHEIHMMDPDSTRMSMSVNLSLKQLQDPEIVQHVREALESSGLDASCLTLEITESLMMADTDLCVQRLVELKELGVRLAMDDFGTGYSSLSYLSRFPVDVLKMDRSFLREGATPKASGLTAAVLALGRTLNLQVVAEGIEHREQWMTLRDLGCDLGQGFYFARPMSAESTMEFLRAHTDERSHGFMVEAVPADAT